MKNCLTLAKAQIGKANVRNLGYGSAYKVYDDQGGPYPAVAKAGVEYIITKLQQTSGVPDTLAYLQSIVANKAITLVNLFLN